MSTFSCLLSLLGLENVYKEKANDIILSSYTVEKNEIFVIHFAK